MPRLLLRALVTLVAASVLLLPISAHAVATDPPNAPTGLAGTVDSAIPWHLRLTWTDNTPASDPNAETFIEIERCLGVGCTDWANVFTGFTPGWDMTSFVDQDPTKTDHTTYSFRVRGRNDAGVSDWSAIASVTTGWRPPAAPTGLVAAYVGADARGLDGLTRLTWQDNATTEQGYQVGRCDPMNCAATTVQTTLPADTTTYSDTTVVDGRTYWYSVVALGGSGIHGFSQRIIHTAGAGLAAPTRLTATPATTGVRLTWRNRVSRPLRIWRCDTLICIDGATGAPVLGSTWVVRANLRAGATSWRDVFAPQAGTAYFYRVQVVTASAVSAPVYVRFTG